MPTFEERLEILQEQNTHLQEKLDSLESQIDKNWQPLYGAFDDREGPTLDILKDASKRNRELLVNPHIGGGNELIASYVWADGIHYDGVPGAKQGRGVNVQELIDNEVNQENFFSTLARKQRQTAFYCDGIAMYYGETTGTGKEIHPVSIQQITDDYRNPNDEAEIWAYRRSWTERKPGKTPDIPRNEWIFVNRFRDKRGSSDYIEYNNQREPIAVNKVMFVKKSNPVVGWAYGIPDVNRGLSWAEEYRQAMMAGSEVTKGLASIIGQIKSNTQKGAQNQAVTLGNATGAGGFAHVGQNNAIQMLTTAGQAYDFSRILPMLANFAAGIGVSVVALSMNSGNAGGSYGAAKALDRPEQLSTKMRREYNKALDREVLLWLGADDKKLDIWFDPIIDLTEKYRGEQIAELRTGTGLYEGEEIKRMHAELDGRNPDSIKPVPDGWLIPNNKNSIELRTIDPNTSGSGTNPSNGGNFAPTQGSGASSNPTGSGDQKSDDIRTNREALIEHLSLSLNITPDEAELLVDSIPSD